MPIATEVDELTTRAAEQQLSAAPFALSSRFVHDQIHVDGIFGLGTWNIELDAHFIAVSDGLPLSAGRSELSPSCDRSRTHGGRVFGNEQPCAGSVRSSRVELNAAAHRVRVLVVERIDRLTRSEMRVTRSHAYNNAKARLVRGNT